MLRMSKRTRTLLALWVALVLPAGEGLAAPLLYVVREFDPELRVVDAADASTLATRTLSLAGETVFGASGLARHPLSGDLYALLWLDGQAGRQLVTLDGDTGAAIASLGDTGDFFSALAFDATGTLFALTHDDASTPSALYTLSLADATPGFVTSLGNGGYGEALGFDPASGLLYHASGYPGDDPIFESVDPADAFQTTALPLGGDPFDEVLGLTGDGGAGLYMTDYLGIAGVSNLYRIDLDSETVTLVGGLGFSDARGLVLVPEPATGLLLALGAIALGARRRAQG